MTQQLVDAFATGDRSVWDRFTDPALVYVTEDDEVKTKAQFLADLQPLPAGFQGVARATEFHAQRAGDAVVTTYLVEEQEIAYGQTLHARYRETDTWKRTDAGYRLVAAEVFAVPHDPRAALLPETTLDEYAGRYRLDDATRATLRRLEDHLVVERDGRPPQTWLPEARDVFFQPGHPRTRRIFLRDAAGRITGFADRREGEDLVWSREGDAGAASVVASPIALGETLRLSSAVLGETRVINVYLPPDYAHGDARFPVLFALDGGMQEDFPHVAGVIDVSIRNQVIRPLVVVGIENTERRRDLVSATSVESEKQIAPHAGGTDRFRRFLREELQPEIAKRYRVSGESAVVGESFAGLFVLETLLQDPELFDTYIAIDPSVWWSGGALVKSAPEHFAKWNAKPKRLFVATADAKEMQQGVGALMAAIKTSKPTGLTASYEPFPQEHHSTIFPVAEVRAYRALFPFTAR